MRAGFLKYKIDILEPVTIQSDYGDEKVKYEHKYTTRCGVINHPTNKSENNEEVFYTNTKELSVRYYVPVAENDIIVFEGENYEILSILPNKEYQEKNITISLLNK